MSLKVRNISFGEFSKLNSEKKDVGLSDKQTITGIVQNQKPITDTLTKTTEQSNPVGVDKKKFFSKVNPTYLNAALASVSVVAAATALLKGYSGKALVNELGAKLNDISAKLTDISSKNTALEKRVNTFNSNLTRQIKTISQKTNSTEELLAEKVKWFDGHLSAHDNQINQIANTTILHTQPVERNMGVIDGIPLLQNVDNCGNRVPLSNEVKTWIENAADRYIKNDGKIATPKPLTPQSSVWSLTVESIPEKEGGLGEVPVQIAKNLTKQFGIDNYLVRPIIIGPGKGQLNFVNGEWKYRYNLDKAKPWEMNVDKIAEFDTQVFRNGKIETEPVSVFTGVDPEFGYKRLMFFNPDYFVTTGGLYKSSEKVSEVERFAFFPKVVYEFTKLKLDPSSMPNVKILNKMKFDEVKAPSAMILNDWHAAAMAALARLKAPLEGEFGELSKGAAETLRDMNFVNINHNLKYQGNDYKHRSEILNTLFGKYTADIYEHAFTKFSKFNDKGEAVPMEGITNVLMTGNDVNLANMGGCLSNKMKPVSPTYARELAEQSDLSASMQHVCVQRLKYGTMQGASNGWDRAVNEVSAARLAGFNNAINGDKITIFRSKIRSIAGLSPEQKAAVDSIMSRGFDALSLRVKIEELRKIASPSINKVLERLEEKGVTKLRSILPYTHADKTETIMLNRRHNKQMFIDFLNSMIERNRAKNDGMFNIAEIDKTSLSHIKPEDLDDIIVFDMGVRFVSQKGVDVACDSIERILKEWKSKYPNKPKPVFVVGGVDAENGAINKFVRQLKEKLGKEQGKQVVWQQGYTPNNIYQAGSDFTLYSSHFEPDGAKWESLNKGTPVICTRVGGHVSSVDDGVNGFLSARTVPEIKAVTGDDYAAYVREMGKDFADAIWRAVNTFYGKNDEYAKMVRNAIDGDQSWLITDKNGNVTGGALLGHMEDLGFKLSDFPQIKLSK